MAKGQVIIDCFPESAERYRDRYAIVVVDVIRSTTVDTTAVSLGWRVFPARTTDEAYNIASRLKDCLMVGELGGNMPYGFDLTNSPVQIAARKDRYRQIVHVSSSGMQLLMNAAGSEAVYAACFRNITSMASYLDGLHSRIAILGAGTHGQFRREDQMGCAWIAEKLIESGYRPETPQTVEYVERWKGVSPEETRGGRSADYLRNSGQEEDLEFILEHIDDLDTVPCLVGGEIVLARERAKLLR